MAVTTEQIEKEVLRLEEQYWQAMKDEDAETCLKLSDDPCIVTGPQGMAVLKKEAFRQMMKRPTYKLTDYKIIDPKVRVLNDACAVIAYKVSEKINLDGEDLEIDATDSSTWIKKDGQWVCTLHTESITGDPYGRNQNPVKQ